MSISYALKNWRSRLKALIVDVGATVGRKAGATTMVGTLYGRLIHPDGRTVDLGLLSKQVVTNAGVEFLVNDWLDDSQNITNMNFHDSGTGTSAESVSDTDLQTPAGPTTRATGTKSKPSSNVIRSVATITYSGTLAITEHGLFNQASRGTGSVLWDRSVFSAINVVSGSSIQFTYECTVNSGG